MSNLQLYLAVALPMIAVLASLTVSLVQVSGIRGDLRLALADIRTDIREIRDDIKILTGKVADIDNRLTILEERGRR